MIPDVHYTEFSMDLIPYLINAIQAELNGYRLDKDMEMFNQRFQKIQVTEEHPLVKMAGNVLHGGGGGAIPDATSIFPAISVVAADDEETNTTIGEGMRAQALLTRAQLNAFKIAYPTMKDRKNHTLITNEQIRTIELIMDQNNDVAIIEKSEFMMRETAFVSVWGLNVEERRLLKHLVQSTLFSIRKDMIVNGFKDISIRLSNGLTNMNFGTILFGLEIEVSGINKFRNFTVLSKHVGTDTTLTVVPGFQLAGYEDVEPINIWSDAGS